MNPQFYRNLRDYCTRYGIAWRFDTIQNPITLIWQVLKVVNELVGDMEELQKAMEDLIETIEGTIDIKVVEVLQGWLNDGTISQIINDELLNEKVDTQLFNETIDNIETQINTTNDVISFNIQSNIDNRKGIKAVAHRGLSKMVVENTLTSIDMACKYGYWGVEFDVQQLADDTLILYHDDTLDTLTTGTGAVSSRDLAYINSIEYKNGGQAGGGFDVWKRLAKNTNTYGVNAIKIPTLEQALRKCKTNGLIPFIEVKNTINHAGVVELVRLIKRYDLINCYVISFSFEILQRIKEHDNDINTLLVLSTTLTQGVIDSTKQYVDGYSLNYVTNDLPYEFVEDVKKQGLFIGHYNQTTRAHVENAMLNGFQFATIDPLIAGTPKNYILSVPFCYVPWSSPALNNWHSGTLDSYYNLFVGSGATVNVDPTDPKCLVVRYNETPIAVAGGTIQANSALSTITSKYSFFSRSHSVTQCTVWAVDNATNTLADWSTVLALITGDNGLWFDLKINAMGYIN